MGPSLDLDRLARLLAHGLDGEPRSPWGSQLLAEVIQAGWAQAAALYRESGDGAWSLLRSRGPADLLVRDQEVAAVHRGELPSSLPLGRELLFAAGPAGSWALALGGFDGSEESLDALEALLQVVLICEADEDHGEAFWAPPLPGA